MARIHYGTYVFSKDCGYYGEPKACPNCGKRYKRSLIRSKVWAHLEYIPLFPIKTNYFLNCPICGAGESLTKKEGREVMNLPQDSTPQELLIYAKHFPNEREKGFLKSDTAYEVWVEDTLTGEKFLIGKRGETTKNTIKNIKKNRGLKTIEIRTE